MKNGGGLTPQELAEMDAIHTVGQYVETDGCFRGVMDELIGSDQERRERAKADFLAYLSERECVPPTGVLPSILETEPLVVELEVEGFFQKLRYDEATGDPWSWA